MVNLDRPCGRWLAACLAGALSLAGPGIALAATATTNFTVSANVLAACEVEATDLDFGDYTASSATPTTATATIGVTCTDGEDYAIALDPGEGDSATVTTRSMTFGTDSLDYSLYTAGDFATVWGDGTGTTATVSDTGDGTQQDKTVHGRIPINQYVPAGAYIDTILVTVTF